MSQELSATIQAIASILTAITALIALSQIRLMRKQIKGDHERSRRHRAVEDLRDWNNHLTESITSARRLVETFTDEQLASVREGKPLRLQKKSRAIAVVALGISQDMKFPEEGDSYLLDAGLAIRLRNLCISHLNCFEITLAAWRHGIADDQILEEQLSYLVDLKKGWKMLEKFRDEVTGLDAYPATEEFVRVITDKKNALKALEEQHRPKPKKPIA